MNEETASLERKIAYLASPEWEAWRAENLDSRLEGYLAKAKGEAAKLTQESVWRAAHWLNMHEAVSSMSEGGRRQAETLMSFYDRN